MEILYFLERYSLKADMSFFCRASGLNLSDRVRSTDTQRRLGVEPSREEPDEVVQPSGEDDSRTPL